MWNKKIMEKLQNSQLPLDDGRKIDKWIGFQCHFANNEEINFRHTLGASYYRAKFNDIDDIKRKIIIEDIEEKLLKERKLEDEKSSEAAAPVKLSKENMENSFSRKSNETREKILGFCTNKNSILDEIFAKHEEAIMKLKFRAPGTAKKVEFRDIKDDTAASERQSGQIETMKSSIKSMDEEIVSSNSVKRKRKRKTQKITIDQLENLFKSLEESIQADDEISQSRIIAPASYRRHPSKVATIVDSVNETTTAVVDKEKVQTTKKISHQIVDLRPDDAIHKRAVDVARSNSSNSNNQWQDTNEIERNLYRIQEKVANNDDKQKHSTTAKAKLSENSLEDVTIDNLSDSFSLQGISDEFTLDSEWELKKVLQTRKSNNSIDDTPNNVSSRSFNFSLLSDNLNQKKISENGKNSNENQFSSCRSFNY